MARKVNSTTGKCWETKGNSAKYLAGVQRWVHLSTSNVGSSRDAMIQLSESVIETTKETVWFGTTTESVTAQKSLMGQLCKLQIGPFFLFQFLLTKF